MDQRRSAWIFRTLLACATLALVVAAVWNFQDRQSFRLPDDGVYWVDTPHGVQALHVDARRAGRQRRRQAGDLLVRMNGVAVANAVQAVRLLAGIGIWNRAAYSLCATGGPSIARLVVGVADRLRAVDYFQFLLAIFYLAIGGFVYWRRSQVAGSNRAAPTPPMVRHFYVFCLASFVLYAFSYSGRLDGFDRFIYWGDVWATLLAPAAFWHFCVIFPGSGQASRLRKTLAAAGYVPVVVMLLGLSPGGGGSPEQPSGAAGTQRLVGPP